MEKVDIAIIGAGPAGLTAAIYASRAGLSITFIEKGAPGGKVVKTSKIENWTGDLSVEGPDLALRMFEHAKKSGASYKYGEVTDILSKSKQNHEIILKSGQIIKAKQVIIATGMFEKIPENIKGIRKYENRGVSYCAICDGPLFKNKNTAVIGGGNSAIEEAAYLAQFSKEVFVFVRSKIRADKKLVDDLSLKKNVKIFLKSQIKEIKGEKNVQEIVADIDGKNQVLKVSGIFPYIGLKPATSFIKNKDILDETGFVITDENMETKIPGLFAVGDVRSKHVRQIATAASDGVISAKVLINRL